MKPTIMMNILKSKNHYKDVFPSILMGGSMLLFQGKMALADIIMGDGTVVHGYSPEEMMRTDMDINAQTIQNLPIMTERFVIQLIQYGLPFLAIACVVILIYNAVVNIFKPVEERKPISTVLLDIVKLWVITLGAWIIVEVIIFLVNGGWELFMKSFGLA